MYWKKDNKSYQIECVPRLQSWSNVRKLISVIQHINTLSKTSLNISIDEAKSIW